MRAAFAILTFVCQYGALTASRMRWRGAGGMPVRRDAGVSFASRGIERGRVHEARCGGLADRRFGIPCSATRERSNDQRKSDLIPDVRPFPYTGGDVRLFP